MFKELKIRRGHIYIVDERDDKKVLTDIILLIPIFLNILIRVRTIILLRFSGVVAVTIFCYNIACFVMYIQSFDDFRYQVLNNLITVFLHLLRLKY